jgi:hypothetical protein
MKQRIQTLATEVGGKNSSQKVKLFEDLLKVIVSNYNSK